MKELSLHILDVAENGITAGADRIRIEVVEDLRANRLQIRISDNGSGIDTEAIDRVVDPFYTSRSTRRVGLGLSLLEAAARQCDGRMSIQSHPGEGTEVCAEFAHDHIDRAPLGDMAATLVSLIMGSPWVDFRYRHQVDDDAFELDTREISESFDGLSVADPQVFRHLMKTLRSGEERLRQRSRKNGQAEH